jgi:DNA-directed RNA polymerase specialized sigma24 family protein
MRSDEKLMADVLARDRRAWRMLVELHEPALRSVVREAAPLEHSLSDDEIDDVLGDFWLLLLEDDLRRLRGFQQSGGSDLGAWLALVVHEVTRKELRRRTRQPKMVAFDDAVENRIAAAVIRELEERGILGAHDQAVPSPGTTKEGTCRDDETNETGSSARFGYRNGSAGGSSLSRQRRRTRRTDELLDTIATRLRRTMQPLPRAL